ncbi:MAG: V-type ATP synthase subunit A [Caldisericia bacterium]|nr:V-type ATP synthase subunit A [Caldisericia bacterium]
MANVEHKGRIVSISGPLIVADNMPEAHMMEVVRIGNEKLFGEIIELHKNEVYMQCYEETTGLRPGEPVTASGYPLSVTLGPGIIGSIYDGIQRPLNKIYDKHGNFIARGIGLDPIDFTKKWEFTPTTKQGTNVSEGEKIGWVQETETIRHFVMIPPGLNGTLDEIKAGKFNGKETVAVVKDKNGKTHNVSMIQVWPVRNKRPYKKRILPTKPLITGQRVIDMFFPVAKGGTACVPGPFGSGKTVIQHQLAKWSSADMIVYIGCGERGNEMTDVLMEFPVLKDPKTGRSLMEKTILIANTSNMPVAAREASVYTGITIAEYFRDMGYNVAIMADSTSRWAEAMREISGRLEEMPGEEGYPAYLSSRIASFYERSGKVETLGGDIGSLSVIGAVSPPGGDLSEPVVQATLRVVKVFWSLEASLAYARHFPAINWLNSYSLYSDLIDQYFADHVDKLWPKYRLLAMGILQKENELNEIVRLVGTDALSESEKLIMEISKSVREDFLHQNAFDDIDTYTSEKKQFYMMQNIVVFYQESLKCLKENKTLKVADIIRLPVRGTISRVKYISEKRIEECDLTKQIREALDSISHTQEESND